MESVGLVLLLLLLSRDVILAAKKRFNVLFYQRFAHLICSMR